MQTNPICPHCNVRCPRDLQGYCTHCHIHNRQPVTYPSQAGRTHGGAFSGGFLKGVPNARLEATVTTAASTKA